MNELAHRVADRVQSSVRKELPRRAALVVFVSIALAGSTIVAKMIELQGGTLGRVVQRSLDIVMKFVPWFLH